MPYQSDGPEAPDEKEVVAQHSEELKSNWQRTLSDMEAMADDRESKGFETLTVPAGDTTTLTPDMGDDDSWGLSHIIPDNYAEDFEELYEESAFEETGVYQLESGGFVFLVTELINPSDEVVIFVAGSYDMRYSGGLVRTAMDRDEMYTHVKTLDHTLLGSFHHDDPSDFFPDPEAFYAYDVTS
ncbi:DUF7529 family protein [Halosimplex amylolyticum]|uniref:DUF7529 family protein n=1 Tax=Halosimplex amylolyticum TaxID=3396616 RepID=UPI003F542A3E